MPSKPVDLELTGKSKWRQQRETVRDENSEIQQMLKAANANS